MQTENHTKIPDDEIDLSSMGQKIYSFFAYPVSLLFTNLKTTFVFIVAAVLLSISVKYLVPKTYRSSFIIRPTDIKDKLHLRVLSDIPVLIKKINQPLLAEALNMPLADVATLRKIEFTNSSSGKILLDSLNCTEITIETTDYNQFIPVQEGIMHYLEKNPYFLKIKTLQDQQVEQLLSQVEKDIVQLDSLKIQQLKNYSHQAVSAQTPVMLNDLVNLTAPYELGYQRAEKKTTLQAQKIFSERFQLIKGCVVTHQPDFPPRILVTCFYMVPLFLLLCMIFLLIKAKLQNR